MLNIAILLLTALISSLSLAGNKQPNRFDDSLRSSYQIQANTADLEAAENANLDQLIQEPLFVSLGSVCEVAHALRGCEMRKAAFPFDWITTIDSGKFLTLLEQDFCHFLNPTYLRAVSGNPGPLLNTYYHIEFLHEGDFRGRSYSPNMRKLQDKYQRRIERFRKLAEYPGKVVFMRTAYIYSTTDPHRLYYCADNLEITDAYASKLYSILQSRFPKLDFTLVVVNNYDGHEVYEEKRLHNNLIKIRANPGLDLPEKWERYRTYFNSLIAELKSPS